MLPNLAIRTNGLAPNCVPLPGPFETPPVQFKRPWVTGQADRTGLGPQPGWDIPGRFFLANQQRNMAGSMSSSSTAVQQVRFFPCAPYLAFSMNLFSSYLALKVNAINTFDGFNKGGRFSSRLKRSSESVR